MLAKVVADLERCGSGVLSFRSAVADLLAEQVRDNVQVVVSSRAGPLAGPTALALLEGMVYCVQAAVAGNTGAEGVPGYEQQAAAASD
jgi:hypothetical protein